MTGFDNIGFYYIRKEVEETEQKEVVESEMFSFPIL